MNIGIFVNTPAQVHFYKNIAKAIEKKGGKVTFLARNYGETLSVLNEIGIHYYSYSNPPESKQGKILGLPFDILKAQKYLNENKPYVLLGFGGHESYTAFLLRRPSIVFNDSEPHINLTYSIQFKLFMPFVSTIITPDTYLNDLGKKHIKVKSYKELTYLHPHYFKPENDIFNILGINKNEEYIIIRFNAFDAVHDAGINGFSLKEKRELIEKLQKFVKVFISAENKLPKDLEQNVLNIPKYRIHDCLYYAKMIITDTQTMATEAGLLGTPAIRYNSFVGKKDMGNFTELEQKYKLIFNFSNSNDAIKKSLQLIQQPNLKEEWIQKKQKLFNDKIDLTAFMVWYIENFPESFHEIKENPELQYKFR